MKNKPASSTAISPASASGHFQTLKNTPAADIESSSGFFAAWARFWFSAGDPLPLHALRFLAGLAFLAWILPFAGDHQAFFGLNGWVNEAAFKEGGRSGNEPIGWSVFFLCGKDPTLVSVVFWTTVAVLVLFTLGLWTRITGILTWVLLVSFLMNPAISYEADYMLVIVAFYLMIGYVLLGLYSQKLSPARMILGAPGCCFLGSFFHGKDDDGKTTSFAANLAVRMFQVHFALIVLTSALHKLQFEDWWLGLAFWYPLHPAFETTKASLQKEIENVNTTFFFLSLAQYLVLAWQLSFPFWAWRSRFRWLLLTGAAVAFFGCGWFYGVPGMGPFFALGCLSYLSAEEWHRITAWPMRVWAHLFGAAEAKPSRVAATR